MDKQALFVRRLPEEDIDLPGVGTVRVRGLSRKEVLDLRKVDEGFERHMIACAMVDPALTPDEVGEWQDATPPNEIETVTDAITRLSGFSEGAGKSGVPGAGD